MCMCTSLGTHDQEFLFLGHFWGLAMVWVGPSKEARSLTPSVAVGEVVDPLRGRA
jgi:hypothetical protein